VDYFKPKEARKVIGGNGYWILTHFHADHYMVSDFLSGVLALEVSAFSVTPKITE
jgi:glyoxylase-like metal-dependent hydrolase (beta-lactamase superfamily II)